MSAEMKFLVAQLGARRHYAVPRILNEAGMLDYFYTDICAVKSWPRLLKFWPKSMQPSGLKRLSNRVPIGIPAELITAFTGFGLNYALQRHRAVSKEQASMIQYKARKRFCLKIMERGLGNAEGLFVFSNECLELLKYAKENGLKTVVEQVIAPQPIYDKLLKAEYENFPEWEPPLFESKYQQESISREQSEWDHADVIICGSEFVKNGIKECGGPVERCKVVPYGRSIPSQISKRSRKGGPLRILTVGAVGLRKGSQYVLEAARQMKGKAVFRMVGAVNVLPKAIKQLRENVQLTGIVPRSEVKNHYEWADVFLLPSNCEGSALVTYEALAYGLPVIATPNTGSIVKDGTEGFIVPMRNPDIIAEKIEYLADNSDLLLNMSKMAQARSKDISIEAYGKRLLSAI